MKFNLSTLLSAAALAAVACPSIAQGPPGGGAGGFQMSPEMQAAFKKMQAFNDSHKNYRAVSQTITGVTDCEKSPTTKLTKDQAKHILATMKKWEGKPSLTNEQAGQLNKELTTGLTTAQIKTVAVAQPFGRRMGGGQGGPGGGRPGGGGPGGPGGGRPGGMANFKMPEMKEYNPLNPDTLPFVQFRDRAKQRLNEFKAKLQATAK